MSDESTGRESQASRLSIHFHRCHLPVEMCNTCREADRTCTTEDLQAGYFERFGVWPDGYGEPGWTPTLPSGYVMPTPRPTRAKTPEERRGAFRVV